MEPGNILHSTGPTQRIKICLIFYSDKRASTMIGEPGIVAMDLRIRLEIE